MTPKLRKLHSIPPNEIAWAETSGIPTWVKYGAGIALLLAGGSFLKAKMSEEKAADNLKNAINKRKGCGCGNKSASVRKDSEFSVGQINPVEVEDLSKHKMDSEELKINQNSADIINDALKNKKKICAVGTTVMRGLESSVSSFGTLNTYDGWTHKFIYPPFEFSIANSMISNFPTPKSTLLMMVSAFGGKDFILKAYKEAMKKKYNFSSYGDAMMII